jgi:glyoxylase-like metal-dependent hydrolase (beta-lactamase superfamily II)
MKTMLSRRHFVNSVSAAAVLRSAALSTLPARLFAAGAALKATALADGLVLIRGAGANVVVLRDDKGLAFIDGGLKANSAELLKLAQVQLGKTAVHTLINTHWHPENTGLNETAGKQGSKIIAHENTKLWLSTTVRYQPDGPPILPLPAVARPNATTYNTGEIAIGDEILRYGYLSQAHTDGDLYVKLVKANVLITGGVVAGNGWPTADWVTGGAITGTASGYRTLIGLCDDNTRVVTSQGERLFSKADLQGESEMITKLSDVVSRTIRAGGGPADVLAANPAKDYVAKMGNADQFLVESTKSLWPRLAPDA